MSDTEDPDDPGKRQGSEAGSAADPIIGQAVGSRLKSLFDEFTNEDVPERFLDLIGQLEQNEKAGGESDDAPSGPDGASPASQSDKGHS